MGTECARAKSELDAATLDLALARQIAKPALPSGLFFFSRAFSIAIAV
jgi:hypothetical protein